MIETKNVHILILFGLIIMVSSCGESVLGPIHYEKPGGLIAFVEDQKIYTINCDGRNLRLLSPTVLLERYRYELKWSPDGEHLAYGSKKSLLIFNRFGEIVADFDEYINIEGYDYTIQTGFNWSNDAQRLVFSVFYDFHGTYVFDYYIGEDEPTVNLTTWQYVMFGDPTLSPNGEYIAFIVHFWGNYFDIFMGREKIRKGKYILVNGESGFNEIMRLTWLDNERLAFKNSYEGLMVVDTLGVEKKILDLPGQANDIFFYDPYFIKVSPDRERLIVFNEDNLYYLNTTTWACETFKREEEGRIFGAALSPDHRICALGCDNGIYLCWFDGTESAIIYEGECQALDWSPVK